MCGATAGGLSIDGVDLAKEAVVQGRVVRDGEPVPNAYVRLLDRLAERAARACVRFDYSGHGESGGDFRDGTIGRWLEESLGVYTRFSEGPQIVVGSSMGGWLALLLARALAGRKDAAPIAGMVLFAPAVDFTEELMWKGFPDATRREIEQTGAA